MNPKILTTERFNSYITQYQGEILNILSRKTRRSKSDIVREAIHFWLREKGIDDGLMYDMKDCLRRLAEDYPCLKEKGVEPEEARQWMIDKLIRKYPKSSAHILELLSKEEV